MSTKFFSLKKNQSSTFNLENLNSHTYMELVKQDYGIKMYNGYKQLCKNISFLITIS